MYIRKLQITGFRNYAEQKIAFHNGTTILFGSNAQGKTNVLEAIFLLSAGRSHRTAQDREMIGHDAPFARVCGEVVHSDGLHVVEIALTRDQRKRILINGIPVTRTGELLGHLCTVIFSPEDLSLIKDSPAARRHFMDMELCQADRKYYYHLQTYLKVLQERNQLLKTMDRSESLRPTLKIWDEQFCAAAVPLIEARQRFCDTMKQIARDVHGDISSSREELSLTYRGSVDSRTDPAGALAALIEKNEEKDIRLGTTTIGPHRDDIEFLVNGQPLRSFGSQGQQRTAALSIKLAEVEYLKAIRGETPVLLLDDVFSELDTGRQRALVRRVQNMQSIITCTGVDHRLFTGARKLRVTGGTVEPLT